MKKHTLAHLLDALTWEPLLGDPSTAVSDIVYDSRNGSPGTVFVALPSTFHDGHDFIQNAYDNGVRCFVVERWPEGLPEDVTVVRVENSRHALALMSRSFFDFPAEKLTVVALTGTKGKTSISYMLKSICQAGGLSVGLIGSNGVHFGSTHVKPPNTTPESYELHRIMADMVAAGVEILILEATSQGFMMHRTDGIHFDIGIYTNISPDHISATEHANFEEYFTCKRQMFFQTDLCLVNRDAELYDRIVDGVPGRILTYGCSPSDYHGSDITTSTDGPEITTHFVCRTEGFTSPFTLAVPGKFNVSNALAAIGAADLLSIPLSAMREGLAAAKIPGRMERLPVDADYTVVIDFAHNKLSMEALFDAVRSLHPNRILTVFGLEGGRSQARRFDCGEVLSRESDYTILADASPRFDDPDDIIADIVTGMEQAGGTGKYEIIHDRHDAIPAILDMAEPGDIVLLIGKGSVPYEEVQGVNYPLNEREIVRTYFATSH